MPLRRRARVLVWRLRFVVAAGCLAVAAAVTVGELRPAPPAGVDVLVAAHDLPAGTVLDAADLAVVQVPERLAVPAALASDEANATLVGGTTAVAVPAGLPLVPSLVTGGALAGPPGTVVAAVRLADQALAGLLTAGQHVDLLAAPGDGEPGVTLAHRALVLPTTAPDTSTGLLGDAPAAAPLLVAVTPDEAAALAGAASDVLFAVVVS